MKGTDLVVADKGQPWTSETERLEAIAMAAAEGLHCLSLAAGGGSETVGGAYCWYSSSFVPAFNGAGLFTEEVFSDNNISAIDSYFRARGRPYSMVSLDGLADEGRKQLYTRGYYEFDSSPAMLLEGVAQRWSTSAALAIRKVDTPRDLAAFRTVVSGVFHISALEVGLILNDGVLETPEVRHYLGLLGDKPVASATMVVTGRMPGIWNVGTMPDYRRRGISTEIMRRLIADAAALGYSSTMLLASSEGLPLYRRLGYRTVSNMRMYSPLRQPGYEDRDV